MTKKKVTKKKVTKKKVTKKKATKKKATKKATVSKSKTKTNDDVKKKLKQLLRKKTSGYVGRAVKLLEKTALTREELDDIFSDRMINLLVNTWDVGVWNSIGPLLAQYPSLLATFGETAADRLAKRVGKLEAVSLTKRFMT